MSKKFVYNLRKTTRSVVRASPNTSKLPRPVRRSDPLPPIPEEPKSTSPQSPIMDSGYDSIRPTPLPLTPTVSGFSSALSTTFGPKDVLAFVERLPTFDGTPRQFGRFITSVEEILMLIRGADQTPYGLLTLRTIRNKIIDRADEALELANVPLVWNEIKSSLIRLYASKKSEANLLAEINSFPDNLTLGQLFFGISKLRSQLFCVFKNSEHSNAIVDAKKDVYNEVCLNAFMSGLREPLKTFVRLKSPPTLEQAYEHCQVEQTTSRLQQNRSNRTNQRTNVSDGRNSRNNNDNNNRGGRNKRKGP